MDRVVVDRWWEGMERDVFFFNRVYDEGSDDGSWKLAWEGSGEDGGRL
jgi:hypothetical protein